MAGNLVEGLSDFANLLVCGLILIEHNIILGIISHTPTN